MTKRIGTQMNVLEYRRCENTEKIEVQNQRFFNSTDRVFLIDKNQPEGTSIVSSRRWACVAKQDHQLKTLPYPSCPTPPPQNHLVQHLHSALAPPFGIPGELPKVLGGLPPPRPACTSYLPPVPQPSGFQDSLQGFGCSQECFGMLILRM